MPTMPPQAPPPVRPARATLAGRRRCPWLLAALACSLALIGAAPARAGTPYVDGIADQNMGLWEGSYTDPSGLFTLPFTDLFATAWVGSPPSHVLYARFVTAPDAVAQGGACLQNLRNWYTHVTSLHLTPVIAVWHFAEGGCADNGVPTTPTYATDITALLGFLDSLSPSPIPYIEAWNEPNADGVGAAQAAAYWSAANTVCASAGCTAIAGDLVDSTDQGQSFNPGCAATVTFNAFTSYERAYVTALGTARPAIWGLHPYAAVNCEESTSVTTFAANLPSPAGQLWFTEVGAWECRLRQVTPRGPEQQAADATYLVDTLMSSTSAAAPAHVFWYELAAVHYTQDCAKYADSALYEASTSPGPLLARPAAAVVYGQDTSLAAETGLPHDVTSTQATFDGTIVPAGIQDASYFFRYGPTTDYGSQTTPVAVGPGLAPTPVSAAVAGLSPGIAYHYQLVATDAAGLSQDGADAVMAPVVVTAAPTTVAAGGSVTVTFSGISDPGATDWIGLYQPGAAASSSLDGFYADSCTHASSGAAVASGSCTYTMPATGGAYEFRLYASPAGGLLTSSPQVSVPTISASPARVVFGHPVTVSWTGAASATADEWVGLYQPGAPAGSYLDWFYADSCTQTANGGAVPAGSCSYTLPSVTGTYELRLYASAAAGLLATSGALVGVPPVPVVRSRPIVTAAAGASRVYVGMTLSCSTGTWTNAPSRYAYAWLRDGAVIAGATGSANVIRPADVGHTLACAVTASNAGGVSSRARSTGLLAHTAPPRTALLGATIDRRRGVATFRFRATGRASGIRCALERRRAPGGSAALHYAPCRSPLVLRNLRSGSYVLHVRAVGPGGPDPTPRRYRFTIKR